VIWSSDILSAPQHIGMDGVTSKSSTVILDGKWLVVTATQQTYVQNLNNISGTPQRIEHVREVSFQNGWLVISVKSEQVSGAVDAGSVYVLKEGMPLQHITAGTAEEGFGTNVQIVGTLSKIYGALQDWMIVRGAAGSQYVYIKNLEDDTSVVQRFELPSNSSDVMVIGHHVVAANPSEEVNGASQAGAVYVLELKEDSTLQRVVQDHPIQGAAFGSNMNTSDSFAWTSFPQASVQDKTAAGFVYGISLSSRPMKAGSFVPMLPVSVGNFGKEVVVSEDGWALASCSRGPVELFRMDTPGVTRPLVTFAPKICKHDCRSWIIDGRTFVVLQDDNLAVVTKQKSLNLDAISQHVRDAGVVDPANAEVISKIDCDSLMGDPELAEYFSEWGTPPSGETRMMNSTITVGSTQSETTVSVQFLRKVKKMLCTTKTCGANPLSTRALVKNMVCASVGVHEGCCVNKILANQTAMADGEAELYRVALKTW